MAIDCAKCVNRGRVIPGADESYCSNCTHGSPWKKDYYKPSPDGIPSGWRIERLGDDRMVICTNDGVFTVCAGGLSLDRMIYTMADALLKVGDR